MISENSSLSKIHVINLNMEKGTSTNEEGEFEIAARLNDSIYFSSIQFVNKTIIVNQEMLNSGGMTVNLHEEMTELAEVIVDDIKLSGHLASDIGKISVKDTERKFQLNMSLAEAIKYDRETYLSGNPRGGLRLDGLFGSKNKSSVSGIKLDEFNFERELVNKSIQLVGYQVFTGTLSLEKAEVCSFVYFCAPDDKFRRLVNGEQTLALIRYFENRISEYRSSEKESIPQPQIPG